MGMSTHAAGLPAHVNVDFLWAAWWEICLGELLYCYYGCRVELQQLQLKIPLSPFFKDMIWPLLLVCLCRPQL